MYFVRDPWNWQTGNKFGGTQFKFCSLPVYLLLPVVELYKQDSDYYSFEFNWGKVLQVYTKLLS